MRHAEARSMVMLGAACLLAACASASDRPTAAPTSAPSSSVVGPASTPPTPIAPPTDTPSPVTTSPQPTTSITASTTTTTDLTTTTTTTTSPPPTIASTTTSSTVSAPSSSCVNDLSIREQAALLVWPSVYSSDWAGAVEVVATTGIGGVLLMRPDGWSADDVAARLAELEAASRHGLIVATDEEGGDVQRLELLARLPSQRAVSETMTPDQASELISQHGALVRAVGVDMVLGPVVDVEPNVGDVPLRPSRFFVGDPDRVTSFASSYVDGWERADLFAVLKHFPGHGAASGDTHITAGVTPSFADIEAWDLRPYRDLASQVAETGAGVMIGHLTVPGLTDGIPATRSRAAIEYLRGDLGYEDALLITDALGMAAVGLPEPEASVLSVAAGIDVVIFTQTSQTSAVIDALVAAVDDGTIDVDQITRSAVKVMSRLQRDGHSCNRPTPFG